MSTPPGWYADPGQTPHLPPQERWWDGSSWSSQTRPAAGAPSTPEPARAQGSRRAPMVAVVTGAAVLVTALVVASVLVLLPGSGSEERAGSSPTEPGGGQGEPDDEDEGADPIPASGVRLPVPEGWQASEELEGVSVTSGRYRCPGSGDKECVRGSALAIEASGDEQDVRKVAEEDIRENAARGYSSEIYGGITAHSVVTSGRTKVAGEIGFRVRWKIANKVKTDAYVESVAFPHPDGSGRVLILRSSIDITAGSPPLSDLSRILAGLREGGASGDGSGDDGGSGEAV